MDPIDYTLPPIPFISYLVGRHKRILARRGHSGEAMRYMREAVDQVGRGVEFIRLYVHNPSPKNADYNDPRTDLALLQLYDHWRDANGWQPIDPWDGSGLRPWLPPENNPKVPHLLTGDLSHFHDAWSRFHPGGSSPDPYKWDPIDAFGLEVESYLKQIRSHSTWSRPVGGGKLRFYRFNELNNIEVAPFSIRFWGFLKWVDFLRRILMGEDAAAKELEAAAAGDIAFMDEFNQKHFTWHDDVFGLGKCPDIFDQFGLKQRHKHMMKHHGYAIEFLEFHGDLLAAYNERMKAAGMPRTHDWMPDEHNSAHILKLAFGGPWGLGNSNGEILNVEDYAPELLEAGLPSFSTGAELGYYLENCGIAWHGIGHVQNCDIRDVYTNNYSIRFFGWHQWIDTLYRTILKDRPKYDEDRPLDQPLPGFCGSRTHFPNLVNPFEGTWVYRSFHNSPDPTEDPRWFVATMRLQEADGTSSGGRPSRAVRGELDSGHIDYRYRLSGYLDRDNVNYEAKPQGHDERTILVMRAEGMTEATRGHVYEYRGVYQAPWSGGVDQVPTFAGSMIRAVRPDNPSLEGTVGTFHSVMAGNGTERRFFVTSYFVVPEGVHRIRIEAWGAGGGGGSDGPGVGGLDGEDGGATEVFHDGDASLRRIGWQWDGVNGWIVTQPWRLTLRPMSQAPVVHAGGGGGGQHGVNRPGRGGAGGKAKHGQDNIDGQSGEDAAALPTKSGKGGDSMKSRGAGLGGRRVEPHNSGEPGLFPGGGGSGGQMAHTPAGGGGGGAYSAATLDVAPGDGFVIRVGDGGGGGNEGCIGGGDGAPGLVRVIW